jgi:hypothetical protein
VRVGFDSGIFDLSAADNPPTLASFRYSSQHKISRAGVCAELLEDVLLHHELVISGFILEELGESSLRNSISPGATPIKSMRSFAE